MTQTPDNPFAVDLDADRRQRAAAREGKKQDAPIVIGGQVIAVLPVELPLDVFEPIRNLDQDVTLVLRSAVKAVRAAEAEERTSEADMVIDILAANPALPVAVIDTLSAVAKNLLTEAGFNALMSQRPTREDLTYLIKSVLRFYGVTPGESSAPSASPEGNGTTSNPTSPASIPASTPATSTPTPVTSTPTDVPVSSGSVAS